MSGWAALTTPGLPRATLACAEGLQTADKSSSFSVTCLDRRCLTHEHSSIIGEWGTGTDCQRAVGAPSLGGGGR